MAIGVVFGLLLTNCLLTVACMYVSLYHTTETFGSFLLIQTLGKNMGSSVEPNGHCCFLLGIPGWPWLPSSFFIPHFSLTAFSINSLQILLSSTVVLHSPPTFFKSLLVPDANEVNGCILKRCFSVCGF